MSESIIKAEKLSVIHNIGKSNEVRSLVDADLEIFEQEYVIIHGPSGCGKSTLLYSMAGLQNPTAGSISVAGKEILGMNKKEKLELHQDVIGMIFQAFYLIDSLNVIDNICLPMTFKGSELKKRREEAMKLLTRFNIAEQAHKFPNQLSGGQKQRVAIARSLINNPKIILADEPVGNLDSESSMNVMQIIKELNEIDKKTIILVTHNDEHLYYGDRIIGMRDGKIISEEIRREKRPIEAKEKAMAESGKEIPQELRVLMRAFSNLTPNQLGTLLVPYKSRQLLTHVLSELTEEQMNLTDNFLKNLLLNDIDIVTLQSNLDKSLEKGGANWDKRRAISFSGRVNDIVSQSEIIKKEPEKAAKALAEYLNEFFALGLDLEMKKRLIALLDLRIKSQIDYLELRKRMNTSRLVGGLGIYKNTVDKIAREIEIIMLLVYIA